MHSKEWSEVMVRIMLLRKCEYVRNIPIYLFALWSECDLLSSTWSNSNLNDWGFVPKPSHILFMSWEIHRSLIWKLVWRGLDAAWCIRRCVWLDGCTRMPTTDQYCRARRAQGRIPEMPSSDWGHQLGQPASVLLDASATQWDCMTSRHGKGLEGAWMCWRAQWEGGGGVKRFKGGGNQQVLEMFATQWGCMKTLIMGLA